MPTITDGKIKVTVTLTEPSVYDTLHVFEVQLETGVQDTTGNKRTVVTNKAFETFLCSRTFFLCITIYI